MTDSTALAGMARAQGAMGALQSAVGAIVTNAAEAEERALLAEARVAELERNLDREKRAAYRRGYGTGHAAGSRGAPATPERAMGDPRSTLSVVA